MLFVITPTDGRPEAFHHLERWVGAQDWPDGFRWVVSGGDLAGYNPRLGQVVVRRGEKHAGLHALCRNLLAALELVEGEARDGDSILICEDDDYYAPSYFSRMAQLLDRGADLAGEGEARYYNVQTKRYRQLRNRDRASLAQTAFRPTQIPKLREICLRGTPFVDLALWREHKGISIVTPNEGLQVSLKGLPGTPGVGMGHRDDFGEPDPTGKVFSAWGIPECYRAYAPTSLYPTADAFLAPLRAGGTSRPRAWEGVLAKRPWEYRVTAGIVHLDTPELLAQVIETLRAQTERPYIVVVDAGSLAAHRPALEKIELDSDDVEIHYLRPRAWRFSSEPVAVAMDLIFARAETEYVYSTHTDVFLKRRDYLADLVAKCDAQTPAVGYQMSPRKWAQDRWKRIVSHTATMYHLPTARRIGLTWNLHRAIEILGIRQPNNGWPDTEVTPSLCYEAAGIGVRGFFDPPGEKPSILLLGPEKNEPYETPDLEHVRSTTVNALYNARAAGQRSKLLADAVARSKQRVAEWKAAAQ
jgi:hypothetical protein